MPCGIQAPRRKRGELQREWIVSSAESGRKAEEALIKAADILADHAPRQRPDGRRLGAGLGGSGPGMGSSVFAPEAARSMAAAAFAVNQMGVNTFPSS